MKNRILLVAFLLMLTTISAFGQSTAFTYQGSLKDTGVPVNGNYDFEFRLYDALTGGNEVNTFVQSQNVPVVNGQFTISLNFGSVFPGAPRYLEVRVRTAGGTTFTTLSPRTLISTAPYAVRSLNAETLNGITSNQLVLTNDVRMTDARNPLPNSNNYIQNTTSLQSSSNFNISGSGSVGGSFSSGSVVTAGTQFNLGFGINSFRMLSASGEGNTTVGQSAALFENGSSFNSIFGKWAGTNIGSNTNNSYFGHAAGYVNLGSGNTIVGSHIAANISGGITTNNSTILGYRAFYLDGLSNASAIGAFSYVTANNSLVLGSINGINGATADTKVGIGTTAPTARLSVFGGGFGNNLLVSDSNTIATTFDLSNTSVGGRTWRFQSVGSGDAASVGNLELWTVGGQPALSIRPDGGMTISRQLNYFDNVGNANFFMKAAGAANGINFGVAGNGGNNSTLYISQYDGTTYQDRLIVNPDGNVQIQSKLLVGLTASPDKLAVNGIISFATLGAAGSTQLCRNASNQISTCSSSLRYKTNVAAFSPGLSFIRELRPISFDWKDGGMSDVGFGAEDLAKIDPRFVTFNDKGEVEGVKYDRLTTVLVNAVQEQQSQSEVRDEKIEAQQKEIDRLKAELEALKRLVCAANPGAGVCKAEEPKQ